MDFNDVQGWWMGTEDVILSLHGLVGKWLQENKGLELSTVEVRWEAPVLCSPLCDRKGSPLWQNLGTLG